MVKCDPLYEKGYYVALCNNALGAILLWRGWKIIPWVIFVVVISLLLYKYFQNLFSETISLMNKDEKTNEREFICINFFSITMFPSGLYLKKQFCQIGKYEYANINISRERKMLHVPN